jgi:MOSC domain-containing protein YiiM
MGAAEKIIVSGSVFGENAEMKIVSIQVGQPQIITYRGKSITTAIFKDPVPGPRMLRTCNLDGDRQADLTVHGGRDKALYAYGMDTHAWWTKQRPQDAFVFGSFGENLSMDILDEREIYIEDTYELGEAIVQVTQPRYPCYKLSAKFQDPSILKDFVHSHRPGVYFRVLREGMIDVGDSLKLVDRLADQKSVRDAFDHKVSPKA